MHQRDIPVALRFLLFWGTAAALAGWIMLLHKAQLLPPTSVPHQQFFGDFATGWTALIIGWASIGQLNDLTRRWLESTTVDANVSPAEAALRRRDRFYRREVRNNKHWFFARRRVQNLTATEMLIFERRRRLQYWLTTLGFWLVTVGVQLPQLASLHWLAFWSGLALIVGFPFLRGLEGLGKSPPTSAT